MIAEKHRLKLYGNRSMSMKNKLKNKIVEYQRNRILLVKSETGLRNTQKLGQRQWNANHRSILFLFLFNCKSSVIFLPPFSPSDASFRLRILSSFKRQLDHRRSEPSAFFLDLGSMFARNPPAVRNHLLQLLRLGYSYLVSLILLS